MRLSDVERAQILEDAMKVRSGHPAGEFLSQRLHKKRAVVLALEKAGIDEALRKEAGLRYPGDLDKQLRLLAGAVAKTGIDAQPLRSLHRVMTAVDSERWELSKIHRFGIADSFTHNQGIATDGSHFWFSGTRGLFLTDPGFRKTTRCIPEAIPKAVRALGCDHIGDIDVSSGKLYAAIEDGGKWRHPYIARFDAFTLDFERAFPIPGQHQPDGAPWVTADAASKRAFTSEFEFVDHINTFDLSTLAPLAPIWLSQIIPHVQGAKIVDGMMYLASDGPQKIIYTAAHN